MQTTNWLAFFDINYRNLDGGVFTAACSPKALQSLENGLIHHCLKKLFKIIVPKNAQHH